MILLRTLHRDIARYNQLDPVSKTLNLSFVSFIDLRCVSFWSIIAQKIRIKFH